MKDIANDIMNGLRVVMKWNKMYDRLKDEHELLFRLGDEYIYGEITERLYGVKEEVTMYINTELIKRRRQ